MESSGTKTILLRGGSVLLPLLQSISKTTLREIQKTFFSSKNEVEKTGVCFSGEESTSGTSLPEKRKKKNKDEKRSLL